MNKHIEINNQISLTDVREGDQISLVKYLNDEEVAANTLLILYPYHATDGDFFLKLCREREEKHGHIVNWAIRNKAGEMIGGIGRLMKSEYNVREVEVRNKEVSFQFHLSKIRMVGIHDKFLTQRMN